MNEPSDSHPAPVVVASFADRGEAEVVAAKLRGAGLDAFVLDDVEGGTIPVEGEAGVIVAVPAHEADTAREILAD